MVTTDQVDDNVIKIDENSNFQRVLTTDQAGIIINFDNDDAMMMKKFPVKPVVCLKIRLFVYIMIFPVKKKRKICLSFA